MPKKLSSWIRQSAVLAIARSVGIILPLSASAVATAGSLAWEAPGPVKHGGACQAVSFNQPGAIALDKSGNIYVGNEYGPYAVQEVTTDGRIRTILDRRAEPIKSGHYFGLSMATRPSGAIVLAVKERGTVERLNTNGTLTVLAGKPNDRRLVDGEAAKARLKSPNAIAVSLSDDLYVLDTRTVRKVGLNGSIVTLAGNPDIRNQRKCLDGCPYAVDGKGAHAVFMSSTGIAVKPDGYIYVADGYVGPLEGRTSSIGIIRRVTPNGVVSTVAGTVDTASGDFDGTAAEAAFDYVFGIAMGPSGDMYVTEPYGASVRRVDRSFRVSTIVVEPDPSYLYTNLIAPTAIAVSDLGALFVVDNIALDQPSLSTKPVYWLHRIIHGRLETLCETGRSQARLLGIHKR